MSFLTHNTSSPENTLSTPDGEMPPVLMEGDDVPGQRNIHDHFATLNAKKRNAVGLLHSVKYITAKRCFPRLYGNIQIPGHGKLQTVCEI